MNLYVTGNIMMKKRFLSLDILKTLAIFEVCSCHFLYYNDTAFDNFVAVFACVSVPMFFMVNGALLMNRPFEIRSHLKKTISLFVILVIWKIITPLLEFIAVKDSVGSYSKVQVVQYFFGEDLNGFYVGHFWFMYALIGIYIVYPLIRKCYDGEHGEIYIKYLAVIIGFFCFLLNDLNSIAQIVSEITELNVVSFDGLKIYSVAGGYAYCIFYFIIGGLLFKKIENNKVNIKWYWALIILIIGWLWLFGLNRYQNSYTNAKWIVINGYERIGTVLLSSGIFILICRYMNCIKYRWGAKTFSLIGNNTMGIYYIHIIIGTYFMRIYDTYFQMRGIGINIIKTLIFVLSGLGITLIMRRIPLLKKIVK